MDSVQEETLASFQKKLNISPSSVQYLDQIKQRNLGQNCVGGSCSTADPVITQIDEFTVKVRSLGLVI